MIDAGRDMDSSGLKSARGKLFGNFDVRVKCYFIVNYHTAQKSRSIRACVTLQNCKAEFYFPLIQVLETIVEHVKRIRPVLRELIFQNKRPLFVI